jgi:acetoacetyl-CoA reductase
MSKRVALITGGTGGIGTAISRHLSTDYIVIATYFKNGMHDKAFAWQQAQKQAGIDCELIYGDIKNFQDCESIVSSIEERFGRLDVLVNNAGMTKDSTLKNMQVTDWHEVIETNLHSVFNLTKNVLPLMLKQNYGRIISIASINGRKGQFGQCNYAASKSALYGFSKSLAQEVAKKGITVNTISPGYIETPMLQKISTEILDKIVAEIPVGRLGRPEEIARAVAFLAHESSGFITGSNIDINGGQYYG